MQQQIALVTAIILPFFNIPLIIRIIKRKSSNDVSLWWAVGVWVCTMLMAPSGFASADIVWRMYNIVNSILFTCVAITVVYFRLKNRNQRTMSLN